MKSYKPFLLSGVLLAGAAAFLAIPAAFAQGQQAASPQAAADPAKVAALPIPVNEIIRRFAQHESEFKVERDNYTYTQEVLVQEPDGGEYRRISDIVFTPAGKRYEKDTFFPVPTLQQISMSSQDLADLENIQPFVLTTDQLPKYDIQFVDTEKVDELDTYVFRVTPKRMEKNQRYFQGMVWVDDHDLAVVKSDGKAVPDLKDNLFPRFVTYRENIEGGFWFPTYTRADDILHFQSGDVRMRMTVRYKNYKRFGSTIKIGESKPVENSPANPQQPPQK